MTPLAEILAARIAQSGPLTIAEYMTECLLHPLHGYYTTRDPFGQAGDFITAPEISQMFGELVGLSLVQAWLEQGAPKDAVLVELGPGRGTLMSDALRAMAAVPGAEFTPHLVEASPSLRAVQAETLKAHAPVFHDHPGTLPDGPTFLIANEFFDALPIRQFLRKGDGWAERQVGVIDGALSFGLSAPAPRDDLAHRIADTADGDMVEICIPAQPLIEDMAQRIASHGGAALIIDYGSAGGTGDTFQAVRGHLKEPPLAAPGQADLTAHVDFQALSETARSAGAVATGPIPQGVFLETLGITARAQALAARMDGAALEAHITAHRRLTHPDEMGSLFQVLGLTPANAPPIVGTNGASVAT